MGRQLGDPRHVAGIRFAVTTRIPRLAYVLDNERHVLSLASQDILTDIQARFRSGLDARGSMPTPKDGGRPMQRTGSFASSFGWKIRTNKRGVMRGVVRAWGNRPDKEKAAIRKKTLSARWRTEQLRAEYLMDRERRGIRGRGKAKHIRKRTVVDQGSLAAILSQPPADQRSRNGKRAVYRVFEPRAEHWSMVAEVAATRGKHRLVADGPPEENTWSTR